jgi:hypothetical protein
LISEAVLKTINIGIAIAKVTTSTPAPTTIVIESPAAVTGVKAIFLDLFKVLSFSSSTLTLYSLLSDELPIL